MRTCSRLSLSRPLVACLLLTVAAMIPRTVRAQQQESPADTAAVAAAASDRYGPFGLLDRRSIYGKYWFPEPLATDESDVDNEFRVDYFHAEKRNHQFDSVAVELEKSFGLVTLEVAAGYESDRARSLDEDTLLLARSREEGFTNIELAGRFPFYQYVSPDRRLDTTFVFGMEVALPTGSDVSKDTELVPKLFNLTRLGDHLAIQTAAGDSILVGPDQGGLNTLEYSAVFGYELTRSELALPGVLSVWPMIEFEGECALNQENAGHNELFGTAGLRINFDTLKGSPLQPRVGIGYTFPVDSGAREEFDWGILTSLILEY